MSELFTELTQLVGTTLKSITGAVNGDEILMESNEGRKFRLYHDQDCCESVSINDINGELSDLVGNPLTVAEVTSNSDLQPGQTPEDSFTWTFYRLATIRGTVVIRWLGSSNGCYSEGVSFCELPK